jgi:hypothetical protein
MDAPDERAAVQAKRPRLAAALFASASAGFAFGVLFPAWHVAIEPAQVLAGLVEYPSGNPFHLYEVRLWNAWHQLLVPLLQAGVPERFLTLLLSGLVTSIEFVAISVFAIACGAPGALAFAAPCLLCFYNPKLWGLTYPVLILGAGHTYGMVGLAWLLLASGVLGCGRWAAGAFLFGIGPAVHASLGSSGALVAGLCALADWRGLRPHLGRVIGAATLGASLAALSLALHLRGQPPLPAVDPAVASQYLDAFVRLWDAHRRPPDFTSWNMSLVAIVIVNAAAALWLTRREIGPASALALRILLACSALGLAFGAILRFVPVEAIPDAVLVAMPTRLINVPVLAFVPLLLGLLGRWRGDPLARAGLVALAGIAVLFRTQLPKLFFVGLPLVGILVLVVILRRARAARAPQAVAPRPFEAWLSRQARVFDALFGVAVAAGTVLLVSAGVRRFPASLEALADRTNDRVLAQASRAAGLIAVAPGLSNVQLLTRRPILIDPGALDMLPYAPAGGPELARILDEIYGLDFFAPPASARNKAVVPVDPVKAVWERRSQTEWVAVATRFGVTDVLAPATWRLELPEVAQGAGRVLYRVPVGSGPSGSQ